MTEGPTIDNIIADHEQLVREVAYHLGREDDEDAIQCGRIGLWEAARSWDGVRPFEPLAHRCIRNNIIDYARRKPPQEDELPEDAAMNEPVTEESQEELLGRIRASFPRRSRERKVLTLLLAGRTRAEVAGKLGVSQRTVDRIARRAIAQIQKEQEP